VRIGIVVPIFPEGVTSSELWLAYGLSTTGHQVTIYCSGFRGSRDRFFWQAGVHSENRFLRGITIVHVSSLPTPYTEGAVPLGLPQMLADREDLLLIEEDYPPFSLVASVHARRRSIPYFLTSERYGSIGPVTARVAIELLDHTLGPKLREGARVLTFHSTASQEYFARMGAPLERLRYIPSCTNCELFNPAPVSPKTAEGREIPGRETVRLLTVARLHPAKGLGSLIQAVKILASRGRKISLVIHGNGRQGTKLESLVGSLGLKAVVKIESARSPLESLPALYKSADVYVQPSIVEPFGMAVVEAMACGLPIVASRTGGLMDSVLPGGNGYLVEPGNPSGIAGALDGLVSDPDLRVRMGAVSRRLAKERFDVVPVAKAYNQLIGSVLGEGRL